MTDLRLILSSPGRLTARVLSSLPGALAAGNGIAITKTGQTYAISLDLTTAGVREKLFANRTYYVRSDGSNSNNGLANTAAGAFQTIQFAARKILNSIDFNDFTVTLQVADGTWTESFTLDVYQEGGGDFYISGNTTTPSNAVWDGNGGQHCIFVNRCGSVINLQGFKFQNASGTSCIRVAKGAQLSIQANTQFGTCAGAHIWAQQGGYFSTNTNYTINGNAAEHWLAEEGGVITSQSRTVTLSGTPVFSDAFVNARGGGHILSNGNTFSGSATGVRYRASLGASIQTFGSGASYFPGSSAGLCSEGGRYDSDIVQASKLTLNLNAAALPAPPTDTTLHIGQLDATGNRFLVDSFAQNGTIGFRRGNNTAASPSALAANDTIGFFSGLGHNGTAYTTASSVAITFNAAEAWGASANGTYITLGTTPIGSTSRAERARVTDVGNIKIAGTATRATTEGTNHLDIFDGTAPVGTLANGISLYSTAGELRVMDAAGNATLLSPHDKATNEWVYDSVDTRTGKGLRIDMERMLRALNERFGWDFVHEFVKDH
jgi:hypothetical protein